MNYDAFIQGLLNYYTIYEKGLKKQANKYIEDYVKTISTWDNYTLNDILFQFTKELCDEKNYDFMKRGNGRIPYALDMFLRDYLYAECLENKMPQLRWFYELYRNDNFGVKYATNMLEKAYLSVSCDKKTVELLFNSWIETLAWGAHHFPDGCIITKETMERAVKQCKKIISEKEVDENLKAELHYFEILYQCYYNFEKEGKKRDFKEYCDEANIEFVYNGAYYYN